LLTEVEQFIDCAENGGVPRSDGEFGYNVVRVLEMVTANRTVFPEEPVEVTFGEKT